MTARDQEFLKRWRSERHHYDRWGQLVLVRLNDLIKLHVPPSRANYFVRIPAAPRLKDEDSLLQKAFYRPEKTYQSPYEEIEDKVGVRLVVLLNDDVRLIGGAIEKDAEIWKSVKARDHEAERADKPYEFVYQSLHFVVRSLANLFHEDGSPLPADLPCEVQVRTLLQHAHSEVTHDTLYKTSIQTTAAMKRAAAKSMALIEATGDYFDQLAAIIAKQVAPLQKLESILEECYLKQVGSEAQARGSPLNNIVLDRYGHDVDPVEVQKWLGTVDYIGSRVAGHASTRAPFRIPAILLVYFKAAHASHDTAIDPPIPDADLEIVYSDLGLSMSG